MFGGGTEYNVKDHGHDDRKMFDDYIASEDKFNDLTDKVVAITGTSAGGLGFYIAEVAIKKQAKILMLVNRDSGSAKKGQTGLQSIIDETKSVTKIEPIICDMQDIESVKSAGAQMNKIAQDNGGLDVLVNNAGIMATRDKRTKDGFEVQMQTNQLSHFLLTSIVFDSFKMAAENRGEARMVTHSSSARDHPGRNLEECFFLKCDENTLGGDKTWTVSEMLLGKNGPWARYHMTKLANSAFAMAFDAKCKAAGLTNIHGLSADPGVASSNLQVSSTQGDGLMSGWMAKTIMGSGHSAENGSLCASMSAFGKGVGSATLHAPDQGFKGPPIATIVEGAAVKKGSEKLTTSEENQKNVWAWCEKGLGIKFDI